MTAGQARAVMNEKRIMAKLRHPFLVQLGATYQDKDFLYMLLGIVQGGELFSRIHTKYSDGIPEEEAKFYAAGIAEGLAFMHRRGFVYRDLKVRFKRNLENDVKVAMKISPFASLKM